MALQKGNVVSNILNYTARVRKSRFSPMEGWASYH